MSCLVTGGTGFLGGHLVEELRAADEPVRVLVRPGRQTHRLETLGAELISGSLEDASSVRRAVRGVQWVFHCGARVADHGAWDEFQRANVLGVQNIVDACLSEHVERLVHVSTSDVYGHPDQPVGEDAPFRRRGYPYGDSKIEGEERVWEAPHTRGLPVVVLRPASIHGPRCQPFVVEIIKLLERGVMFRLGNEPKPAGLAYVTNVTDALRLAAVAEGAVGRAYNVHDGLDLSWEAYVDRLADLLGLERPRVRIPRRLAFRTGHAMELAWRLFPLPGGPPLSRLAVDLLSTNQGFATARIRDELGWVPRVGLEEGLARTAAWWRVGH